MSKNLSQISVITLHEDINFKNRVKYKLMKFAARIHTEFVSVHNKCINYVFQKASTTAKYRLKIHRHELILILNNT